MPPLHISDGGHVALLANETCIAMRILVACQSRHETAISFYGGRLAL
jgi:hypothetical protein